MNIYFWKSITDEIYKRIKPRLNQKNISMEEELRTKDPAQYAAMKSLEKNKLAMIFIYSSFIALLLAISILIVRLLKL